MVEQAKKRPEDIELRQKDSDMESSSGEEMQLELDQQRKTARKTQARKRTRTASQTVITAESDSASVDSLKFECTASQLMELVEEALKGEQKSLERLMDDNLCAESIIEEVVEALEDDEALRLYHLIFQNNEFQKPFSVYGQTRWLRYLLAEKEKILSTSTETRKMLEPLVDRRQAIADQCLKLRGKLDLLLESAIID